MVGNVVIGKDGKPVANNGQALTASAYQPPDSVSKLYAQCQNDYQRAYDLQHRPFKEFDGRSLLQRTSEDQETFGAYVGAEYVPSHKQWRWRGRKNTSRNRLISILANMIAGMLYPLVSATNEENEPDKLSARVMRIVIENHLKKANYEIKFMYMALSALVLPAVHVEVAYYEATQRIKEDLGNGKIKVTEAVDEFLSGLNLNLLPVDQILPGDFYVNEPQKQPFYVKLERLPYDTARAIYAGKHFDKDGKDLFDYVVAGKTRVFISGNENGTLYDIEWTEGDRNAVQIATFMYRPDDLEVPFVAGIFMGNEEDVYNSNRFSHRRMSLIGDEWKSIPIYPIAKSYYEPIDPTGRFYYGKSGAFKEYWDDAGINHSYRLLHDGTTLEVIKPLFISGVAKVDDIVIAPGAVVGMPQNAAVTPWSMQPALAAAMQLLQTNEADVAMSTKNDAAPSTPTPGIPATQTLQAAQQAARQLSVFALMIADLVQQLGELTVDCTTQHTFSGEIDATVPASLLVKYKTIVAKTREQGRDVTNRIHLKSNLIGRKMTTAQKDDYEWKLWKDKGGDDQVIWHVNPYMMARRVYSTRVDADQIVNHALGSDRQQKMIKYQMLTQPFVYPFANQKQIADDVIEEFSDGDPDRLKGKGSPDNAVNTAMSAIMGKGAQGGNQGATPPAQGATQLQK